MGASNKGSIHIEMIIGAPTKKVWKAWTRPEIVMQWFGSDPEGIGISADLDVRAGGAFMVTFSDSDHTEHTCSGIYTLIEEPERMNFTWTWKNEPGVESFVELVLIPYDEKTRMKFTHSNLGNESRHNYLQGWKTTFLKLVQIIDQLK